jgi:hypothetical protein
MVEQYSKYMHEITELILSGILMIKYMTLSYGLQRKHITSHLMLLSTVSNELKVIHP